MFGSRLANYVIRLCGFGVTLIVWDTLVLDRWLWLLKRCPPVRDKKLVLDVGCGSGAFSIGLARRGYQVLGLTHSEKDRQTAKTRASLTRARNADFDVQDVRLLDRRTEFYGDYDIVVCLEVIEHILDDSKLVKDVARCLKPGGRLFLTTPNIDFVPISPGDAGPFPAIEDGWHVRKGYGENVLRDLFANNGLEVDSISFCSGLLSQKITWLFRFLCKFHLMLGWLIVLPLRLLPPLLDPLIHKLVDFPMFSICVEAHKPIA